VRPSIGIWTVCRAVPLAALYTVAREPCGARLGAVLAAMPCFSDCGPLFEAITVDGVGCESLLETVAE
jgi:hypothetical protein